MKIDQSGGSFRQPPKAHDLATPGVVPPVNSKEAGSLRATLPAAKYPLLGYPGAVANVTTVSAEKPIYGLLGLMLLIACGQIIGQVSEVGFGWIAGWIALATAIAVVCLYSPRLARIASLACLLLTAIVFLARTYHHWQILLSLVVLWGIALNREALTRQLSRTRIPVNFDSVGNWFGLLWPIIFLVLSYLASHSLAISGAILAIALFEFCSWFWTSGLTNESRRILSSLVLVAPATLLLSWSGMSVVNRVQSVAPEATAQAHAAVLAQRRTALANWKGPSLAVLLSGGGYRAAVTHAGLLSTLDRAHIPVRLLSTVSGGSIVGGAYASGWTPEEFRDYLRRNRPGLSRDALDIWNVLRAEVDPLHGSGETFAAHLDRNYFGRALLTRVGPPSLAVNATRFDTGTREVFWNGMTGPAPDLAHAVAASGAFPAAFDPVYIAGKPYIDGGVIENLGVEGLNRYLELNSEEPTPGILIVSDLSAAPAPLTDTVYGPVNVAARANDLVYEQLESRIYDPLAGRAWDPHSPALSGYTVSAGSLWKGRTGNVQVFILAPTTDGEMNRLSNAEKEVALTVRRISTLVEPSADQVDASFWLGTRVAQAYLPSLCKAAGIDPCPAMELPALPHPAADKQSEPITPARAVRR